MSDDTKPAGSESDRYFETPEEREKRQLAAGNLQDAETEFRLEQDRIQKERNRVQKEREKLEKAKTGPAKLVHLVVAKLPTVQGIVPPFKVVGFYSSRALLAENIGLAAMKYAETGAVLGIVDFDLSIKQDQPVVDPE